MASYASTFTTLQSMTVDKLRLDATADATRVQNALNQVLVNVAVETRYFSGSTNGTALVAAATSQALPTGYVELRYVTCTYGGQTQFMQAIGFDRMLMLRSANGNAAAGPPYYYNLNKDTLEFWPPAAGGEVLAYYGVTLPTAMSAGSDVSGLPEPYATNLLVEGACVEMAEFKNDARVQLFAQDYAQWLGRFNTYLNKRKTENSQAFPVYGPDGLPFGATMVPHDVSSDFYVTGWPW